MTSCKPTFPEKTYLSQVNFVTVTSHNFYYTVYFCQVLRCLCFYILLTFGVFHNFEISFDDIGETAREIASLMDTICFSIRTHSEPRYRISVHMAPIPR